MAHDFRRMEEFFHEVSEAKWFPAVRDEYRAAWSQPGALTAAVNYYRASPLHPPTADQPGAAKLKLREEDFMVRVPTLVIWGERDAALLPVLLEGLDRMVPDLRIERLPEATHWLVHEEPGRIVAWMRDFLGI
jgi:pimeloyl-ACP methyl ester carboxylesterase